MEGRKRTVMSLWLSLDKRGKDFALILEAALCSLQKLVTIVTHVGEARCVRAFQFDTWMRQSVPPTISEEQIPATNANGLPCRLIYALSVRALYLVRRRLF